MRRKKFSGQLYTFVNKKTGETDTGILPENYGESNDFAYASGNSWSSRRFALENKERAARKAGHKKQIKQIPGQPYTFVNKTTGEKDSGILPLTWGESNDFVYSSGKSKSGKGRFCSRRFSLKCAEKLRRSRGSKKRNDQVPGSYHTFTVKSIGNDSGILPLKWGENSDFAVWIPNLNSNHGGGWESRKLRNERAKKRARGFSVSGLTGRMSTLLSAAISRAKKLGYAPPNTTPKKMVNEYEKQEGLCKACRGLFKSGVRAVHYDHDHETGECRGFLHGPCNFVEGVLWKFTKEEFDNFISWVKIIQGRG